MKTKRETGSYLERQFNQAYRVLARNGHVDSVGSFEYVLLWQQWKQASCPTPVRDFVLAALRMNPD